MIARFQFVCNRYIKKGQKLKKHVYQQVRACKKVSQAVTKKQLSIQNGVVLQGSPTCTLYNIFTQRKSLIQKKTCIIRVGKEMHALNIIASYSVTYAHSETIHKLTGADSPNVHLKNVFVTLQRSVCRVLCLFIRLKLKKAVFLFGNPKT